MPIAFYFDARRTSLLLDLSRILSSAPQFEIVGTKYDEPTFIMTSISWTRKIFSVFLSRKTAARGRNVLSFGDFYVRDGDSVAWRVSSSSSLDISLHGAVLVKNVCARNNEQFVAVL